MTSHSSELDVDSPFRADFRTMLGFVISILIGAVATAAGVGGGAIYIPIFNTLIGFALKPSTALSQACITAGSLAAFVANLPRTHPSGADVPLIDVRLMLMLTPVLLVGVGIGVLLNVMLPSWLLNILLLVLLLLLLAQAIAKGRALWEAENKVEAEVKAAAAAAEAAAESAEDGVGNDHADLMPRGVATSSNALPSTSSTAAVRLRNRRGMSYSSSGKRAPNAELDLLPVTPDGADAALPYDVIAGGGGVVVSRTQAALSPAALAVPDGGVDAASISMELTPPDSPVVNMPHDPPHSWASLETAPSWLAFNELGFLESESDGEDIGSGWGGSAGGMRAFSARSPFSLPVFPRPSKSVAQLMSMLAMRPPGRDNAGPLLERRASFDPHSAAVIATAAAAEGAGAEPDSWLARRSKWRSRFPPSALPHRTQPPAQQQRSASVFGKRSTRQRVLADTGASAAIAEPLLNVQHGAGPPLDPQECTIAEAAAEAGGGGSGRGDPSGAATVADVYRPPTPLETLHEEGDDEVTLRDASRSEQLWCPQLQEPRIPGSCAPPFASSPFATAAVAIEAAADAAGLASLPLSAAASEGRDMPPGLRTRSDVGVSSPAVAGARDDVVMYGSATVLTHRRYGSRSASSLGATAAAKAAAGPALASHLELEGPAGRDDDGGGSPQAYGFWRGRLHKIAASGATKLSSSRSKWVATLARVPRNSALALLASWGLYLGLQALRAERKRCEPAWWALFAVQISVMLSISIGAVFQALRARRARATVKAGAAATEEGLSPLTAAAPAAPGGSASAIDHEFNAPAVPASVAGGDDAPASATIMMLRSPIKTLAATFGAGLTGGLLGLGGGMVMGPLMLQMGIHPQVTAATSGAMVLFSSSCALAQFAMLHRLNLQYAGVFGLGSLVAGLVGTSLVARAVKRSGRPSLVVLALAGVMAVGTLCVGVFGLRTAVKDLERGRMGFQGLCGDGPGR